MEDNDKRGLLPSTDTNISYFKIKIYSTISSHIITNISFILPFKGLLRTILAPWRKAQCRLRSLTNPPRLLAPRRDRNWLCLIYHYIPAPGRMLSTKWVQMTTWMIFHIFVHTLSTAWNNLFYLCTSQNQPFSNLKHVFCKYFLGKILSPLIVALLLIHRELTLSK